MTQAVLIIIGVVLVLMYYLAGFVLMFLENFVRVSICLLKGTQVVNNGDPKTNACDKCYKDIENDAKFCTNCGKQHPFASYHYQSNLRQFRRDVLSHCAITLTAYVAKADGVVSEKEALIISDILTSLSDGDENKRQELKNVYAEAKNKPIKDHLDIATKMATTVEDLKGGDEQCKLLLIWLVDLVYADGARNVEQYRVVEDIAYIFGIDEEYLDSLCPYQQKYDDTNESQKPKKTTDSGVETYYNTLKCTHEDSDEQIKKSYRELAKQYHPDSINSKGLAEDFLEFASSKFKEINIAYEAIKKYRGMN